MVGLWGMSDELGPVSYGVGETHPFLGRELGSGRAYAESTASRIDAAVAQLSRRRAPGQPTCCAGIGRRSTRSRASRRPQIVTGARLGEILAETSGSVERLGVLAQEAAYGGEEPAQALSAA